MPPHAFGADTPDSATVKKDGGPKPAVVNEVKEEKKAEIRSWT